jgi:hypothetical protein
MPFTKSLTRAMLPKINIAYNMHVI